MKNLYLVATLIFGALLYGCGEQGSSTSSSTSGPWTGEIHPDANAPSKSRSLGKFMSYDECVEAAVKALGGDGVFNCSLS